MGSGDHWPLSTTNATIILNLYFQTYIKGRYLENFQWNCHNMNATSLSDNESTLVLVKAMCHQATNHYLSRCWPRCISRKKLFLNCLKFVPNGPMNTTLILTQIRARRKLYDGLYLGKLWQKLTNSIDLSVIKENHQSLTMSVRNREQL